MNVLLPCNLHPFTVFAYEREKKLPKHACVDIYTGWAYMTNILIHPRWWASLQSDNIAVPQSLGIGRHYFFFCTKQELTRNKGDILRRRGRVKDPILISNNLELNVADEGLAESPAGGCDVISSAISSVAELDSERQALTVEIAEALPVGTPVPRHCLPAAHS